MSEPADEHPGAARIDRWLFAVRLLGSRALATAAVRGGRVHVNGERVKPERPAATARIRLPSAGQTRVAPAHSRKRKIDSG